MTIHPNISWCIPVSSGPTCFCFPCSSVTKKRNGDTWPSEVGGKTEQHMWMTNQRWKKTEDLTQSSMPQYIIGFNYSICICIFIVIGFWSYGCPMDNVWCLPSHKIPSSGLYGRRDPGQSDRWIQKKGHVCGIFTDMRDHLNISHRHHIHHDIWKYIARM